MKTLKFLKISLMLAAITAVTSIVMSFNSMKPVAVDTVYYYVSNDMNAGAFRDVSHWSTTNNEVPCVADEPELPCQITVPAGFTLSGILGSKSNSEVLQISEGYKAVQ